ncbi:GNAT family N-acetyltransferase [Peribacillus muralis]|uniref:GNAT family N-acetyltransferase n=1 Tax=Peribacillus TaxID=2675229 RepID=UPI001925BF1B|nr:GNAT family N-acetyltransferase [Peribacillus muralis]MBL3646001.1 GNAT family N-acetyltransferase [Bacillus sp. RHFB]MCK1995283.1 GNAT family N-acetyltransferase [Peribacillus muralis]MCK2015961.1 GNAT family N-acetyltransferase [Peribacillus muralis]
MQNTIRVLSEKDLEEESKIFTNIFSSNPWNEPWSLQTSYKRLLDISKTPGYIGIGYFNSNNQMIGFLVGNEEQWADSKHFYINEICVLNNIQQNGVGTSLLKYLGNILTQRKVDAAYLSTERGKGKPELFFRKNGFVTNESRILMTMSVS